ncbi:MAG: NADH-quinone oxidoreductase subunit NuoH [Actinomycetota bacterium]
MPLLYAAIALVIVLLNILLFIWLELKILAHIQDRLGPMRTGRFHGWLQPIADVVKLLNKEDIVPEAADRLIFKAAPFVVFVPVFMTLVTIPLTQKLMVRNLDIGVFYVFALSAFTFVGMVMAGWASYNKYSLLGAFRAAGQLLSYELPLGLSIVGVVMLSGSLSLVSIVDKQTIPYILLQPAGFMVFFLATVAELTRTPFDIPQAESELVAGFFVEYSGMRWALFFLAEYASLFILAAVGALLFLGGWKGPLLPPILWFFLKVYALFFIIVWIRGTMPRVRPDQLMALGWKILLPVAFINIVITGLFIVATPIFQLWLAISEFVLLGALLYLLRRLIIS